MEIFHRREQPEKWGMWSKRVKRPPVELRFHCQRNVTTNYHPPLSLANLEMDKQIKTSWFLFLCKCKPLKKLHISESSSKRDLFHLTQRNDESGQFCWNVCLSFRFVTNNWILRILCLRYYRPLRHVYKDFLLAIVDNRKGLMSAVSYFICLFTCLWLDWIECPLWHRGSLGLFCFVFFLDALCQKQSLGARSGNEILR